MQACDNHDEARSELDRLLFCLYHLLAVCRVGQGCFVHNRDCGSLFKEVSLRPGGQAGQVSGPTFKMSQQERTFAELAIGNGMQVYRGDGQSPAGQKVGDFLIIDSNNVNGWLIELKSKGRFSFNSGQIDRGYLPTVRSHFNISGNLGTGEGIPSDIVSNLFPDW